MSWFDAYVSLTGAFTPITDDQTACAEVEGTPVCVPFGGRPLSQAVGGTLGGSYVFSNDAETLGAIFRLSVFGGAGPRHWQVGGGASAGFLATIGAIDLSIEAGYHALFLTASDHEATDAGALLHTLSGALAIGGRISSTWRVFIAPQLLLPVGGDDALNPEATAFLLSIGAGHDFDRQPIPKEIVVRVPDPDEEARVAAVRAALMEAEIRLRHARAHLEPGWFATHIDQMAKLDPEDHPVGVELAALWRCAEWIQHADAGRDWMEAKRRPLNALRAGISASTQTVLAGHPTAEQQARVGQILEEADKIVPDTTRMIANYLLAYDDRPLVQRLIQWGRELQGAIAKATNGVLDDVREQTEQYERAVLAYQSAIKTILPIAPREAVPLQEMLGIVTCLQEGGPQCTERFSHLYTEPYDTTITVPALSQQLEHKGK